MGTADISLENRDESANGDRKNGHFAESVGRRGEELERPRRSSSISYRA